MGPGREEGDHMVKRTENPFTLTFGKEPYTAITRYEDLNMITDTFQAENPVTQTFLIEGIRGCGKTVLMTFAAKALGEDDRWIVIHLNPMLDLLSGLASRLHQALKKGAGQSILERGIQVSAAGFGLGIGGNSNPEDCINQIEDSLEIIRKRKKRVLITIDEVMPGKDMRVFASQYQIFLREGHPLFLIMTGLYENIYAIQNDPALTFLLRAPKIKVGPLSILQITRQYRDIFEIGEQEAKEMADITKGYAFAFQALGSARFQNPEASMETILEKLEEMLDDCVYRKIWAGLTKKEREITLAIDRDNIRTKEVCEKTSIPATSFPKYRETLIRKGILIGRDHGYLSLALPRFYNVVRLYDV